MIGNNFVLWENDRFLIKTPFNPHVSYQGGPHIIVAPKADVRAAWDDIALGSEVFALAAKACKIMEAIEFAPWFNIQANGNWGLLPDATPFFHLHIYGRNRDETWGRPVELPSLPGTYTNEPMPLADRERLIAAFQERIETA